MFTDVTPWESRIDEAHVLVALGRAYASPGMQILPGYRESLEQGIEYLDQALTLYDRPMTPLHWARAQSSLGSAYADRVAGDRASNQGALSGASRGHLHTTPRKLIRLNSSRSAQPRGCIC